MLEFPSTKDLLGDLVALKPHTLQGQRDVAEYIRNLAMRWNIGDVQIVDFPETAKLSDGSPKPCNIIIEKGVGTEETIVSHTHFDSVPPTDFPRNFERQPHQLTEDPQNPDICYANAGFDDLSHLAADLVAFHRFEPWKGRKMVLVSVSGEEDQSQGTHALFHPDFLHGKNPILKADGFISGEIPVASSIDDPQTLLIGRPGRVGLHLEVFGDAFHTGKLRRVLFDNLVATRGSLVKANLKHIFFPEHPNDPLHLMPESLCAPGTWRTNQPRSLTVVSKETIHLDVIFTNPALSPTEIHGIVNRKIAGILGDENFILTFEAGRELPFTKPYLESPDNPFVRRGLEIAANVNGQWHEPKAGRGTADEPILVHESNKPCIIFPTQGEDEHLCSERVRISSIDRRAAFVEQAATFDRPLTRD